MMGESGRESEEVLSDLDGGSSLLSPAQGGGSTLEVPTYLRAGCGRHCCLVFNLPTLHAIVFIRQRVIFSFRRAAFSRHILIVARDSHSGQSQGL